MTAAGAPCPPNTIWFYGAQNKNGEFSNFWAPEILQIGGRHWKTTEHYFQAMKFEHSPKDFNELAAMDSPMAVAKAGRERSRPLRKDWEDVKDDLMFEACLAKFSQNPPLWDLLNGTRTCVLVERTRNDHYWGDGGDGTGKNMLGITLVKVRTHIRAVAQCQQQGTTTNSGAKRAVAADAGPAADAPCPRNTIWFYATKDPYGEFANFYPCPHLILGDSQWRTTEHYFQAMKFEHSPKDFFALAQMTSPMDVAKAGRERSRPLRKDWEEVKNSLMLEACLAKFTQNPEFGALLEATGDCILVERTRNDHYWGDGGDGTGKNMLGITLMQVREILRDRRKTK